MAILNKDISNELNELAGQLTGQKDIENIDLTDMVSAGRNLIEGGNTESLIGKVSNVVMGDMIKHGIPSVEESPDLGFLRSPQEYGSILRKFTFEVMDAYEDPSRNLLVNGEDYAEYPFYAPDVTVKYFEEESSWMVPYSIKGEALKTAFHNANEVGAFLSGVKEMATRSFRSKMLNLEKGALINLIGALYNEENISTNKTSARFTNVLTEYNKTVSEDKKLTMADNPLKNPDFNKFLTLLEEETWHQMQNENVVYSGGKVRKNTEDDLVMIELDHVKNMKRFYLQADTYNKDLVAFNKAKTIASWQGVGLKSFDFDKCSTIDVKVKSSDTKNPVDVKVSGVLSVIASKDSVMVSVNSKNSRVDSYNGLYDFQNTYLAGKSSLYNDLNEQVRVFYIADEA